MPFAAAIALCSQSVSQILYGAASDSFSHSVCWAVYPNSGCAVCDWIEFEMVLCCRQRKRQAAGKADHALTAPCSCRNGKAPAVGRTEGALYCPAMVSLLTLKRERTSCAGPLYIYCLSSLFLLFVPLLRKNSSK